MLLKFINNLNILYKKEILTMAATGLQYQIEQRPSESNDGCDLAISIGSVGRYPQTLITIIEESDIKHYIFDPDLQKLDKSHCLNNLNPNDWMSQNPGLNQVIMINSNGVNDKIELVDTISKAITNQGGIVSSYVTVKAGGYAASLWVDAEKKYALPFSVIELNEKPVQGYYLAELTTICDDIEQMKSDIYSSIYAVDGTRLDPLEVFFEKAAFGYKSNITIRFQPPENKTPVPIEMTSVQDYANNRNPRRNVVDHKNILKVALAGGVLFGFIGIVGSAGYLVHGAAKGSREIPQAEKEICAKSEGVTVATGPQVFIYHSDNGSITSATVTADLFGRKTVYFHSTQYRTECR